LDGAKFTIFIIKKILFIENNVMRLNEYKVVLASFKVYGDLLSLNYPYAFITYGLLQVALH